MDRPRCETCRFYRNYVGVCARYAPGQKGWPIVDAGAWCGEHKGLEPEKVARDKVPMRWPDYVGARTPWRCRLFGHDPYAESHGREFRLRCRRCVAYLSWKSWWSAKED